MLAAALATLVGLAPVALGSSAGIAIASSAQDPVVVGDAAAIVAGVELRSGATAPYVTLATIEPVAVGDGVRTDSSGYAEITYFDGSLTRLDVETEFEVVELVDDAGVSTTRTTMRLGRTWHRVESLGEGEYTVETLQATATVRGTAFLVDCPTPVQCAYLVVEGIIAVTMADGTVVEVVGPALVEVVDGVAGAVTPVTPEQVLGDSWLADNVRRDTAAGFADLTAFLAGIATTMTTSPDAGTVPASTTSTTSITEPPTTTASETSSTTDETSTTAPEPSTSTEPSSTTAPETSSTMPETTTTEPQVTTSTEPQVTTTSTEPQATTTTTDPQATTTTTLPPTTTTLPPTTTTLPPTTTTLPPTTTTLPPTTTTLPPTTTTTTVPNPGGRFPVCHNTGDGFQFLRVGFLAWLVHLTQHAGDFVPANPPQCGS